MRGISTLENSTVIVTGASGFIGSHLVDYLVEHGCIVHALVRKTSDHRWLNKSDQVKLYTVDLEHKQHLPFIEKADYLFHCAGVTKAKTREKYFSGNAFACESLYGGCAALRNNFKAIIHLSSLAAVGPNNQGELVKEKVPCRPITYYGESKLEGEKIAIKYSSSLPIVVIRPPVVYGPRELFFLFYLKAINRGWKLKIGKVTRKLSLIYVADLVRAMVQAALCFPKEERIYYVTDGNFYTWDKIADSAMRALDVRAKTLVIPESLLGLLGNIFEAFSWFGSGPAFINRQRVIDIRQKSWIASPESFFKLHEFQPKYDLDKGLFETVKWCKENNWL